MDEKKWYENPLWMPRGSVRALVTIGILYTDYSLLVNGYTLPDWLQIATGTVLGFYFGARTK